MQREVLVRKNRENLCHPKRISAIPKESLPSPKNLCHPQKHLCHPQRISAIPKASLPSPKHLCHPKTAILKRENLCRPKTAGIGSVRKAAKKNRSSRGTRFVARIQSKHGFGKGGRTSVTTHGLVISSDPKGRVASVPVRGIRRGILVVVGETSTVSGSRRQTGGREADRERGSGKKRRRKTETDRETDSETETEKDREAEGGRERKRLRARERQPYFSRL